MFKEDVIRKILVILHCHLITKYHINLLTFIITTSKKKKKLYYSFLLIIKVQKFILRSIENLTRVLSLKNHIDIDKQKLFIYILNTKRTALFVTFYWGWFHKCRRILRKVYLGWKISQTWLEQSREVPCIQSEVANKNHMPHKS